MKAFQLVNGVGTIVDMPRPVPLEQEALIKILRACICGTDFEMTKGYFAEFEDVPGHEFVGIVVDVNSPNPASWMGKRVVGDINLPCMSCDDCSKKSGNDAIRQRNHCSHRQTLGIFHKHGAFAEYIKLPLHNLHEVPDSVSDEEAVFVEPLAAACRILEQRLLKSTDKVAIIGDGKLGLLIAEVLTRQNLEHRITHIGKNPEKLALLEDRVTPVIYDRDKTRSQLENAFDVTVECSASPKEGFALACALTRPLGTVILKTTCTDQMSMSLSDIVVKELVVVGSRCGPQQQALELLSNKHVSMAKYISKTFPFSEISKALEYSKKKGVLKVQLIM